MVGQHRSKGRSWMARGWCTVLLALAGMWLGAGLSSGAEVNGVYTEPTTKDLGEITKIDFFKGLKFRGWIDVYFEGNFNDPSRAVVDANQNLSAVKSRDVTIEGRTFDVHDRSFSLSLAELEIEKVPDVGSVGFKLDIAFGDTQDIIVDTTKAASGKSSVSDFDRYVQHASISYVAPIGRGIRLDFGKFVTHIGAETIESIKNHNYSRGFLFTYGTPGQDTGLRVHYDWTDALYTELYVLNGWNVTSDNNKAKTFGPSIGWTPSSQFSLTVNYLVGNEQTDNDKQFENLRHIFDVGFTLTPIEPLNFQVSMDYAWEQGALHGGTQNAHWGGIASWVRYKVTDVLEPALRVEYYRDAEGFTTGLRQSLVGVTVTVNYKLVGIGKFANILVRPEYRFDHSNEDFFTHKNAFRSRPTQHTLGVGTVVYF